MDHKSPLKDKIADLLSFDTAVDELAKPGGLLSKMTDSLFAGNNAELAKIALPIIRDLLVQRKLKLPADALKPGSPSTELLLQASNALAAFLPPGVALASQAALGILKMRVEPCGVDPFARKIPGMRRTKKGENDVVLYFVERKNGLTGPPLLPVVDGDTTGIAAMNALDEGFMVWAGKLNLEVSAVGDQDKANLLVTGAELGENTATLAKTEIGPPDGLQLRMLFNLSKKFTTDGFISNVAHEFGHALGIFHEDVDMRDETLVMHGTLLGVIRPTRQDIDAAVSRGWTRS